MVVKKYGNRRLYDTEQSSYITLEELADKIRKGADVTVLDAKTSEDITQATLAQIILESRGAARLLPVPLLKQLVRMGDDALAEFFGRYMTWALEVYLRVRKGAEAIGPFPPPNPFPNPFPASTSLLRFFFGSAPWEEPPPPPPPPAASPPTEEIAELRRELEELKRELQRKPRK